jgi:putative ABC transport system permease protein
MFYITQTLQLVKYYRLRFSLALISLVFAISALVALLTVQLSVHNEIDNILNISKEQFASLQLIPSNGDKQNLIKFVDIQNSLKSYQVSSYLVSGNTLEREKNHFTIIGVGENFFKQLSLSAKAGRVFLPPDNSKLVAVIGESVAKQLLQDNKVLNNWIFMEDHYFEIIGVLNSTSINPLLDFDINRSIFIDANWLRINQHRDYFDTFVTTIPKDYNRHKMKELLKSWYPNTRVFVRDVDMLRDRMQQSKSAILKLLTIIAFVTSILGVVSMLNLWLIILEERRPEIALRRLVGARISDIVWQFGTESTILCLIGGIFGLVFGHIAAYIIVRTLGISFEVSWLGYVVGSLFALVLGAFLGFMSGVFAHRCVFVIDN